MCAWEVGVMHPVSSFVLADIIIVVLCSVSNPFFNNVVQLESVHLEML